MIHHSPNVIGPVYIRLNNEPVRAALPYFCERVIRGVNVLIVVNANLRAAFCNFSAMALPIPREDPVIKAYLPFSDIPFGPPLCESQHDQTLLTGRRKK